MESRKLEIVLHSGKSLNNVKTFGSMDPYVVVWISGGGKETKPLKTKVAKRGCSFPVWNYSMDFNISSMNNNYTLFCEIKHDGHMADRNIGQVQIPFKDLLAGDASGENVSYPVKISSGEVKGEIILSHKFSQPEVNEKDGSGKVTERPKKKGGQKKKKKNGMMKRIGKTVATQVASKAILLAGTAGLLVVLKDPADGSSPSAPADVSSTSAPADVSSTTAPADVSSTSAPADVSSTSSAPADVSSTSAPADVSSTSVPADVEAKDEGEDEDEFEDEDEDEDEDDDDDDDEDDFDI